MIAAAPLPADFSDLLVLLAEHDVEYMLVGGYAVMAHGHVRATSDLAVWVRPSAENASRVLAALAAFGLPPGLSADALTDLASPPPTGFRFGRAPLAVDLLASIRGFTFDEAWPDATTCRVGELDVRVIGRRALLANKRATGRAKDLADVEALEALGEPTQG